MYQPRSQLDRIQYKRFAFASDRRTTDCTGQDNREGKPDIVDIDLNKGTETGTRNQTRDGIQKGRDDRPTIQ
jgi:hypothetical protein